MCTVSVIMPAFNTEQYIQSSVESVLNQTFKDFELIIIDDGSTDKTYKIAQAYNDSRIKLYKNKENIGERLTGNKAISLARGKYIARQDSDDVAHPDRLKTQIQYLEQNPDISLVGSWVTVTDSKDNTLHRLNHPVECHNLRWHILFYNPFCHSSVMFKKDAVVGRFDLYDPSLKIGADWDLLSRLATKIKIHNIPKHLITYRVHDKSISKRNIDETENCNTRIRTENIGRILGWDLSEDPDKYTKLADNTYLILYERGIGVSKADFDDSVNELKLLCNVFSHRYQLTKQEENEIIKETSMKIALAYSENGACIDTIKTLLSFVSVTPMNLTNKSFYYILINSLLIKLQFITKPIFRRLPNHVRSVIRKRLKLQH